MHVCVHVLAYTRVHMQLGKQLVGVSSFFPQCGFWVSTSVILPTQDSNSDHVMLTQKQTYKYTNKYTTKAVEAACCTYLVYWFTGNAAVWMEALRRCCGETLGLTG